MSEKRFFVKKIEDDFCILDSFDDDNVVIYCDSERIIQDCCELLNELVTKCHSLEKENEQLRQFINKGRRLSVKELMDNINENELLKKKIRELEKEKKELENEHERQNNEIKLLRQEHRRLRNQVREWEKIYCYTKKFYSINDLDINLIKGDDYVMPSVIEITFGEIIEENKRLRYEFIEMKKELLYYKISNGYPNGNKEWEELMKLEREYYG